MVSLVAANRADSLGTTVSSRIVQFKLKTDDQIEWGMVGGSHLKGHTLQEIEMVPTGTNGAHRRS